LKNPLQLVKERIEKFARDTRLKTLDGGTPGRIMHNLDPNLDIEGAASSGQLPVERQPFFNRLRRG
jgi:hypothetical protein